MITPQAILFDLDGTLIDTELAAGEAVKKCLKLWGIDPSSILEDARYLTGRKWEDAFQFLFKKYQIPVEENVARKEILIQYQRETEENLFVVPGSVEAVQLLSEKFPLALVSGSFRSQILWALKKLKIEDHFQFYLGAEDYPRSKPQPDGYLKAVQKLGVSASNCLVFEDSVVGIASAKAAGLRVIAITCTNHFSQDLSQADHQIPDFQKISLDWITHLSFD